VATLTGLTIVKAFAYRDEPKEEFSNQYWFKGPPPGDTASWDALLTEVMQREQAIYTTETDFLRVYGYDNDDPHANHVYVHDFEVAGTPPAGQFSTHLRPFAGDQAACVSWKTDKLNSRGKPIYLRKYHHDGGIEVASKDQLEATWKAALVTYADAIRNIHGGLTNPTSDNHPGGSETAVLTHVIPWVTTRTLKRRGKRPKAGN